jgi:hypothetical protein
MHRPTYIALMAGAGVWGLVGLISLWFSNKLLFTSGVVILGITAYGALLQSLSADSWALDWLKLYTIPAALLVAGQFLGLQEMQNEILRRANLGPLPSMIPGNSEGYPRAVFNHFLSMLFPVFARGVAGAVGAYRQYRQTR